ncbi:MAG: hypothetical protein FWG90_01735 [Oscillospiraceae bacterium]|nr:hypothetical protein [Oscillospiraceae bacterium]
MKKLLSVTYFDKHEEKNKTAFIGGDNVKEIVCFDENEPPYCEITHNDNRFERIYNISETTPLTPETAGKYNETKSPELPPVSDAVKQLTKMAKNIDAKDESEPSPIPTPVKNSGSNANSNKPKNKNNILLYIMILVVLLLALSYGNNFLKQMSGESSDTTYHADFTQQPEESGTTSTSQNNAFVDEFRDSGISDGDVEIDLDNTENIGDIIKLDVSDVVLKFSSLRNTETLEQINAIFGVDGVIDAMGGTNDYIWRFNDTTMVKGTANVSGIFRDLHLVVSDNDLKDSSIMPVSEADLAALKEKAETTALTYDDFEEICGVEGTIISLTNGRVTSWAWIGDEIKFRVNLGNDGFLISYDVEYVVKETVSPTRTAEENATAEE